LHAMSDSGKTSLMNDKLKRSGFSACSWPVIFSCEDTFAFWLPKG
jgi:hypothetical protein